MSIFAEFSLILFLDQGLHFCTKFKRW